MYIFAMTKLPFRSLQNQNRAYHCNCISSKRAYKPKMINKLRFKPSPLSSGRQRSISKLALTIRCYAAFNFTPDSSSDKRITHRGPAEKFRSETSLGRLSPGLSRHEVQVFQNLKCSEPNYSEKEDDDDFAELGMPVLKMQNPSANSEQSKKLMVNASEKAGRLALATSLPGKVESSTNIPPKQNIHQPGFSFNLEDRNGVSRTKAESEMWKHAAHNIPSHKSSNCVIIDKVPLHISVSQLREAMSVYGEVSNAFMRSDHNGSKSCQIEFKTVESSERALVARRVTIRNYHMEIRNLHVQESLLSKKIHDREIFTVRISNISMNTAAPTIHSICTSCGPIEGLWKMKEGYVDVSFSSKDNLAVQSVLKKLNDVRVDDCQWSAQLLPKVTTNSMTNGSDAKAGVGSQISNLIGGLKEQLQMKRIYLEDLENLHHAILHLKECSSTGHQ